jgi:hypothetical protein
MALKYPDILQHNNPSYSLVDITSVRGTAYQVANLSATGSIPTDKRNIGTIIFVTNISQFYGFYGTNVSQWDDTSKWKALTNVESANRAEYLTTGSSGTSQTILGSLTVNEGITGSIFGNATSANSAGTASFTPNALVTASVNLNTITFTKGNGTQFNIQVNTGSAILLPGGQSGQIQYNNSGVFGGVSRLTFDGTTLRATGSFTGSFVGALTGTASWAQNSISSSYILSTNVFGPYGGNTILTSSYALTASYVDNLSLPNIFPVLVTGSTIYSYNSPIVAAGGDSGSTYVVSPLANVLIGPQTALSASYSNSVVLGNTAGAFGRRSDNLIALGTQAAYSIGNSLNSIFIGINAGSNTKSTSSIFIGDTAGYNNVANNSINLGTYAGFQAYSSSYSVLIGFHAGANEFSSRITGIGRNNIIIGTNITLPDGTNDYINLGGILFGSGTYYSPTSNPFRDTVGNGRIGINVVIPQYNLDVSGSTNITNGLTVSGSNIFSGSQTITGSIYATGSNTFIGNQTISGSIYSTGSNTLIGNTTISGSLNTTGSNVLIGSTTISGSLNTTGSTNLLGTSGITGSLNITGSSTIIGTTIMTGSLDITGSTTQIGNNTLIGNTKLSGSIGISGSSTIVGTTTISGSLEISGSTTQIGNNTLKGDTLLSGSIIISGALGSTTPTIQVWGDTKQHGYIQFEPVAVSINNTVSASYIYVSGSTQDLYFSQNGSGYNNTTRLRWLEGNLYTGILKGGVLSSTPGSTQFTVTAGDGIIVTMNAATGSDPYPTIKYINWPTQTLPIRYSGSANITYVGLDDTGQIIQQTNAWGSTDPRQWHTQISLGVVLHLTSSVSTGVFNSQQTSYGTAQKTDDFLRAFGPLKISGHTLQSSGSTLGLIKTAGVSYKDGANYTIDPNHTSTVVEGPIATSKRYRYYLSGSTPIIDPGPNNVGYPTIDNKNYYNLITNQLTAFTGGGNNKFTIQRVFWIPNSPTQAFIVYYGNDFYASANEAVLGLQTEPFSEAPNTAQNAIYLGAVIVEGSATSLTTAVFIPGGIFRSVGGVGASGGSSVATALDNLSDVALTTRATGDLLMYGVGGAAQWGNTKILSGDYGITGSLSLTGNVNATASWATNALTASSIKGGSDGRIPLWSGIQNLTSSIMLQSGSTIQLTGSLIVSNSVFIPNIKTGSSSNVVMLGPNGELFYTASNTITGVPTFPYTGSAAITGSLILTGSLNVMSGSVTASLYGTSSWATNALTASVITGGRDKYLTLWSGSGGQLTSSIIYQTGSSIGINSTTPTGSLYVSGGIYFPSLTQNTSQSFVLMYDTGSGQLYYTSSKAIGGSGTGVGFPYSGSAVITGSLLVSGSGITGSLLGTASNIVGGTTNYIPVWNGGSTLTGSILQQSGSNIVLTGSLIVSNSVYVPNIQTGSSSNVVMLGANGQLMYTSSAHIVSTLNTLEIDSNRYDFFTYIFNNGFPTGFELDSIATTHTYSPNLGNIEYLGSSPANQIEQYISYLYVDILDIATNQLYTKRSFSNVAALQTFIGVTGINEGRITLYSYKNNTSNLRIYGSNQMATLLSPTNKQSAAFNGMYSLKPYRSAGKIASNYKMPIKSDLIGSYPPGHTGFTPKPIAEKLINYFTSGQFHSDLSSQITNPDEIITQDQIDALAPSYIKFLKMDKYNPRRLTNFYVDGTSIKFMDEVGGGPFAGSEKTKIISTVLGKFNLNQGGNPHYALIDSTIETVAVSATGNYSNKAAYNNIFPDDNSGFFNIYILQDNNSTANYGLPLNRAIAIEFLSIDAINIPFNSKNTNSNYVYFAKKANRLDKLDVQNAWWNGIRGNGIDPLTNTHHMAINTDQFTTGIPTKKNQNKNIDIIRIYNNKTCDVFDDCLKVVESTYTGTVAQDSSKLYYYKLNKK